VACDTLTIVIESPDGEPIDVERIRALLGGEFKTRTWAPGDHIITRIAVQNALEALGSASRLLGGCLLSPPVLEHLQTCGTAFRGCDPNCPKERAALDEEDDHG
jgi:hypothetical protein